jgi:hypothetical protein
MKWKMRILPLDSQVDSIVFILSKVCILRYVPILVVIQLKQFILVNYKDT